VLLCSPPSSWSKGCSAEVLFGRATQVATVGICDPDASQVVPLPSFNGRNTVGSSIYSIRRHYHAIATNL